MEWAWWQGHYHTFLNYPVQMFKFKESKIHWGLELVTSPTCHEEFLSSLPTGNVYCSCSSQTWAWPHSDLPTSLILIKLSRTQDTYSTFSSTFLSQGVDCLAILQQVIGHASVIITQHCSYKVYHLTGITLLTKVFTVISRL